MLQICTEEIRINEEWLCVMEEMFAKAAKRPHTWLTDTESWLAKFREKWLQKNQPSELCHIETLFRSWESL